MPRILLVASVACMVFAACTTRTEIVYQQGASATACEGGVHDAASDTSADVASDHAADVVSDHAAEVSAESGAEAAAEASVEAGFDAPADVVPEAIAEAGQDVGTCAPVGASAMVENDNGNFSPTISTAPVTTQALTTILVGLAYHDAEFAGSNGGLQTPIIFDNKSNTYTPISVPIIAGYGVWPTAGVPGQNYQLQAFACVGCAGGPGHVVSTTRSIGNDEATLYMVEVPGTSVLDAVSAADSFTEPMALPITTNYPNDTLVLFAMDAAGYQGTDVFTAGPSWALLQVDSYVLDSVNGADEWGCAQAPGMYNPQFSSSLNEPQYGSAVIVVAVH
jgi:hypothetical protein